MISWKERFYDIPDAAALGGINPASFRKYIERGEIAVTRLGGMNLIAHSALLRLLAEKNPARELELQAADTKEKENT